MAGVSTSVTVAWGGAKAGPCVVTPCVWSVPSLRRRSVGVWGVLRHVRQPTVRNCAWVYGTGTAVPEYRYGTALLVELEYPGTLLVLE